MSAIQTPLLATPSPPRLKRKLEPQSPLVTPTSVPSVAKRRLLITKNDDDQEDIVDDGKVPWLEQSIVLTFSLLPDGNPLQHEVGLFMIPGNTVLYRGRPEKALPSLNRPLWFSSSQHTAELYGFTDIYKVKMPMLLLNLADPRSHELARALFREWATAFHKNKQAFDDAYPLEQGTILRDSTFDTDSLIVEWFVDALKMPNHPFHGLAGFATPDMKVSLISPKTHHAEMAIIHPSSWIEYVDTLERDIRTPLRNVYAYHDVEKKEAAKRKRQRNESLARRRRILHPEFTLSSSSLPSFDQTVVADDVVGATPESLFSFELPLHIAKGLEF